MKWFCYCFLALVLVHTSMGQTKINRKALVARHNVVNHAMDTLASLTVGNGRFAFTVDATGLQTFPEYYANGVPLGTQSEWGWHSFPNLKNTDRNQALQTYDLEGRKISYRVQPKAPQQAREAVEYFRVNPHRLQLGNIGLNIILSNGSQASVNDIREVIQELDLWTGTIQSKFKVEGFPVQVTTVASQQADGIAFSIRSPLLKMGRILLKLRFPYPNGQFKDVGTNYANDQAHQTNLTTKGHVLELHRQLDTTHYWVSLKTNSGFLVEQQKPHTILVKPQSSANDVLEGVIRFAEQHATNTGSSFQSVRNESIQSWNRFWNSGAAIDFAGSTNPNAFELERRVVLSQYLLQVQESGSFPPQETGLTYNSWYGKPHLEMHWWHAVHFAQWNRPEYLERSLDWYFKVSKQAFDIAKRQGFEGLRWQKMTDHSGEETPSSVGAFLIWQQPHFIYLTEMLYRAKKNNPAVLKKYAALVEATADFMASFPSYDSASHKYNLGKGLIPAQECFDAVNTFNPTYELAYWSWALQTARQWRLRLGQKTKPSWEKIIQNLAPLPQQQNVYLASESTPDCYTNPRYLNDHPAVLGAYASLPAVHGMDTTVMWNTFQLVHRIWNWKDTWGWDYPLAALCAARLHQPQAALDVLMMNTQKNTYLKNGHNYQDGRLTIYLPGNGGLLSAAAFMCTGGDADAASFTAFPETEGWKVKWEGLVKLF